MLVTFIFHYGGKDFAFTASMSDFRRKTIKGKKYLQLTGRVTEEDGTVISCRLSAETFHGIPDGKGKVTIYRPMPGCDERCDMSDIPASVVLGPLNSNPTPDDPIGYYAERTDA